MSAGVSAVTRSSPNGWTVDFDSGLTVLVIRNLSNATISTMRPVASHSHAMPRIDHSAKVGLQRKAILAVLADLAPVTPEFLDEDVCGNLFARLVVRLADL